MHSILAPGVRLPTNGNVQELLKPAPLVPQADDMVDMVVEADAVPQDISLLWTLEVAKSRGTGSIQARVK